MGEAKSPLHVLGSFFMPGSSTLHLTPTCSVLQMVVLTRIYQLSSIAF